MYFKAFGFNEEESNEIKDVLLTADLYGIESHGMQRMVRYHKGIQKRVRSIREAKPEVVFETPISAVDRRTQRNGTADQCFCNEEGNRESKDRQV